MPKIILPTLPGSSDDLLSTKSRSSIKDSYTLSTYAPLSATESLDSGLMSQVNGRLTYKNIYENAQIRDYHIQPGQVNFAGSDSMLPSATIYGNGIAANSSDSNYVTLPGTSFRWYQPFDTSVSLMQWSFFISYNAWRGHYKDLRGEAQIGVETPIFLRCRLDDNVVSSSSRLLGQNFFHPQSPGAIDKNKQTGPGLNTFEYLRDRYEELSGTTEYFGWPTSTDEGIDAADTTSGAGTDYDFLTAMTDALTGTEEKKENQRARGGNPKYVETEAHSAVHFDFHHSTSLSKGFHEISVEASIFPPEGEGVYLQNLGREDVTNLIGRGYFNLVGKISLGVRNARVLNLL